MPDIFDYMDWRGDLGLERDGFNEVDNLILSSFSYVPLDGLVPEGEGITIGEAARKFSADESMWKLLRMRKDKRLFDDVGRCPRFAGLRLHDYVNTISIGEEKQFAAVSVELADGSIFVAFRGTDNTLVGWKEDFNMSFMRRIPAQAAAVDYLEKVAARFDGPLRVGGHSKGGNLAVYASAFCSPQVQARITEVYNNDGPWLHADMVAEPGYRAIRDRIRAFIPQTSVIGMLLEHEERYTVVRSNQFGLFQHDFCSWEVVGPRFVYLASVTNGSRFVDRTIKTWLAEMEEEQRSSFVDALFQIINASGARTFQEMGDKWYTSALAMLKSYATLDSNMRKLIGRTLKLLLQAGSKNIQYITNPGRMLENQETDQMLENQETE